MPTTQPARSLPAVLSYASPSLLRRHILNWRTARRLTQLLFLVLFLGLFRNTEYTDQDTLGKPVNLFFRLDPLAALTAMISSRAFILTFWPSLLVIALTLFFGRAFCGWICPLGTLLDLFHRLLRPMTRRTNNLLQKPIAPLRMLRHYLLIFILLSALLAFPILGYLDPFSILTRSFATLIDPAWYALVSSASHHIDSAPAWSQSPLTTAADFLKRHALPFQQSAFALAGVTAAIIAALFILEIVARRFWCRYLCPLGGLLGLLGRYSLVRRLPVKDCGKCPAASKCAPRCRMNAFSDAGTLIVESCNLCMDCVTDCPPHVARFKFKKPSPLPAPAPVGLSRRGFLTAGALGVSLPLMAKVTHAANPKPESLPTTLLRPPGVADRFTDHQFLNRCIRCGECLKVCTTNGLQPAGLQSGLAGIFSPILIPRSHSKNPEGEGGGAGGGGYCEFYCTLCAQVCPTGAIPLLPVEKKQKAVIGKAAFDRSRCLPWAKNEACLCCEEHCPLPEKAIQFDVVTVPVAGQPTQLQRPWVDQSKCIGCGICENKCPLDGPAAIHVYRTGTAPEEKPHMAPLLSPCAQTTFGQPFSRHFGKPEL